jgi:uncharacterized protein
VTGLEVAAVIALGMLAGTTAGLFGVGGGIVFVPTLTLVLGLAQLEAEATSLLAIIPVAVLGTYRQHKSGQVKVREAVTIGVASIGSAIAGALIADNAPDRALRLGFAALLIFTAIQLARGASRTQLLRGQKSLRGPLAEREKR